MKSGLTSYVFIFIILGISISQSLFATKKNPFFDSTFSIDFRSTHIWRGTASVYSPTIEPSFEINRGNYTSGIWIARSLDGNYTEMDLYITFENRNFSFTIYDYYCPSSIQASNEITNFETTTTDHLIELDLAFKGTSQFPIKILIATMIYGNDLDSETNRNNYSTYLQFAYSTQIDKNNLDLFLGLNTFKSCYGDTFGIVNAGITVSQNLNIFKTREIPIQASLVTNPYANSLLINFGFNL